MYLIGSPDERIPPDQKLVVGVVKDAKIHGLEGPDLYQSGGGFGDFEVRYTGNFGAVAREVREAIHAINRSLPITNVTTMDAARSSGVRRSGNSNFDNSLRRVLIT